MLILELEESWILQDSAKYRCKAVNRKTGRHARKFTVALWLILGHEEMGIRRFPKSNKEKQNQKTFIYKREAPEQVDKNET